MNRPLQAVILCGGKGTRLLPYTSKIPKPMAPCNDKPFLWYLLSQLNEQGISHFVLLTGYLSEKIESYFEDGSSFGWQISYSKGPVEWKTGKRLWAAKEKLDETFLLLYSDNFTPFSLDKIFSFHHQHNRSLTFMVSKKSPGNIALDSLGTVKEYNNTELFSNYYDKMDIILNLTNNYKFNYKLSELVGVPDTNVLKFELLKALINIYDKNGFTDLLKDNIKEYIIPVEEGGKTWDEF